MRLGTVDPNSFSETEKVTTSHISLNWTIDFDKQIIEGSATYIFNVLEDNLPYILLDTQDIDISGVFALVSAMEIPVNYIISDDVSIVGSKLTLELPEGTSGPLVIRIEYKTSPEARALQWLTSEQTLGKEHPYLFSQCQPIHARSLLPCQDSPAVKFTYSAIIKHPKELTALMSAIRIEKNDDITKFEQTVPIPSYLLAIAVGKVIPRSLGPNQVFTSCNVWAEEGIINECAEEFTETPEMLATAAEICGSYVWKQFDLLVMPPSFPFGGMENPCLTFVTPTLLAGDKSLVDVVAHEIAHSWTGNLVTNKNFEHFWLNEGFTVFVEGKIIDRLKGSAERDFHSLRNLTELAENIRTQLANTPELTKLVVDLSDIGPDDAFSSVPYVKGSTFLRHIEDVLGGPSVFEPFFRYYLVKYRYMSVITDDFKETMYDYFSETNHKDKLNLIDWDKWLYCEGMPPVIPQWDNTLAVVCLNLVDLWNKETVTDLKANPVIQEKITSHQLIDFLGKLIECKDIKDLSKEKINLLETTYNLDKIKNAEIRFRFMRLCIKARILSRLGQIIEFANSNFRMKFVRPIYRDLGGWPEAKSTAVENFKRVENQMMKVCSYTVRKDLELN